MMVTNGVCQADSISERSKVGQDTPEPKGDRLGVLQHPHAIW